MKRISAIFIATALLSGCGGPHYTVTGHYGLTPGDSVYLLGSGDEVLAAGVMDADTTFTLKGRIAAPELASLSDRYATVEPAMLFLEAGTIRIEPRNGSGYRVTGTRLNDRADSVYRSCAALDARLRDEKLSGGNPETIRAIASERDEVISTAVRANNDNLLGAYLFRQFQSSGSPAGVRERLAEFSPEMRAHPILRGVLARIEAVEKTAIGQPYTDLALCDAEGAAIPLSSVAGKANWVLLDFWATWCAPCCREIPHLREAYAAYKAKGFEIYCVSLDNDEAKWRSFTSDNDMPWINVLGIDADKQSTAAAAYGITSIPANFLISPDGIIVAKNLRGGELSKKLAEMLE